ncbi:hypothetical protein [Kitasatospora cheerisanensis]|uniref:Holin n=1 Tax=Kitasatospora cheerisanensis KCTC 2395 TaxID=1348663 RepID=A0A066YWL2_9ACTN|nr:hypothetical protein [Kitasatospora cheerisanensis]KDN84364.1 hypothetical protein KCH_41550 [Kitasatospora cheerisanensis KCTC 2395]
MQDSTRRTIRTTVQTAITVAALLPLIVDAARIPATLPWVAGALTGAAALTRVMALPAVNRLLPSWLRLAADPDAKALRQAVRE